MQKRIKEDECVFTSSSFSLTARSVSQVGRWLGLVGSNDLATVCTRLQIEAETIIGPVRRALVATTTAGVATQAKQAKTKATDLLVGVPGGGRAVSRLSDGSFKNFHGTFRSLYLLITPKLLGSNDKAKALQFGKITG